MTASSESKQQGYQLAVFEDKELEAAFDELAKIVDKHKEDREHPKLVVIDSFTSIKANAHSEPVFVFGKDHGLPPGFTRILYGPPHNGKPSEMLKKFLAEQGFKVDAEEPTR